MFSVLDVSIIIFINNNSSTMYTDMHAVYIKPYILSQSCRITFYVYACVSNVWYYSIKTAECKALHSVLMLSYQVLCVYLCF